jgi:hypothetical protein
MLDLFGILLPTLAALFHECHDLEPHKCSPVTPPDPFSRDPQIEQVQLIVPDSDPAPTRFAAPLKLALPDPSALTVTEPLLLAAKLSEPALTNWTTVPV